MTKQRVVVAMSGGVDSSLTAALLLRQGYEVIGVTMRLWSDPTLPKEEAEAGPLRAIKDAKAVADMLGIEHHVADFQDLFKEKIISYFTGEYQRARTPNPCVICNQEVKFGALLAKARQLGADYLATGHYIRVVYDEAKDEYFIKKGIDPKKDQSYMLYHMKQDVLKHLLFPLGNMKKSETRQVAEEMNLPVAHKKESQDICFIPDNDYKGFLQRHCPQAFSKGKIIDTKGNVVGKHNGLASYTIGQRKGLGLVAPQPLYVIGMDQKTNTLLVGENKDLFIHDLIAENVSFIAKEAPTESFVAEAKIRYAAPPARARITPMANGRALVSFEETQRAITPGQSVVFYDGDTVLGGGIISKPIREE
ncbi:MAG: tRNA 2-thiouridine(34) synthase MnmA [Selenomonadales bacterium]|nr:tRNA 2-thiouridine(34) synthase MnmA [Selenomonadales bacterium]